MRTPNKKYFPIVIVEVLILQRFPYGKTSGFFYYASGKNLEAEKGDLVKIPWRNVEKLGIIIGTKRVFVDWEPGKEHKTHLVSLIKSKNYFYSNIPFGAVRLKPICSIMERKYISPDLLLRLKTTAEENFVSWNHLLKLVVNLPRQSKTRQPSVKYFYLPLLREWLEYYNSSRERKNDNVTPPVLVKKNAPFIFLSQDQEEFLRTLLKKTLQEEKQVLVVVPEKSHLMPAAAKYASLTDSFSFSSPILLGKFLPRSYFRESWQLTRSFHSGLFIGTRSAIFAPFSNLGLIILEDGHDSSHKQWDMLPRYDARTLLPLVYTGATKVYLSETPRLQDFFHSPFYLKKNKGKIYTASLDLKFFAREVNENRQPEPQDKPPRLLSRSLNYKNKKRRIVLVNMETEKFISRESLPLSGYLKERIISRLSRWKWVFLLANHKGLANTVICRECGFVQRCPRCGKTLSLNVKNSLSCRYCGYFQNYFANCPKCSGHDFTMSGFGVEKIRRSLLDIEKEVKFTTVVSPDAPFTGEGLLAFWKKMLLDLKKPVLFLGYAGLWPIARFFQKEIGLAGILSFDELLYYPDFRSEERAASRFFNLLSASSELVVQTRDPLHPLLQKMVNQQYSSLFSGWLAERKKFNYPPFSRLVRMEITAVSQEEAARKINSIIAKLRLEKKLLDIFPIAGSNLYEKNKCSWHLIIKFEKEVEIGKVLGNIVRKSKGLKVDLEPEELM